VGHHAVHVQRRLSIKNYQVVVPQVPLHNVAGAQTIGHFAALLVRERQEAD
jgi:hypothetical protein